MTIRFAQSRDIPEILNLLLQVGQVHHEIRPDLFRVGAQKYDAAALEVLLRDEKSTIFAAVEEGKLLGYCFCQLREYDGHDAFTPRKELYIDDLCVEESCRNRHVGKALYEHVRRFAKEAGCAWLTLNVWQGNESAMAFYQHRGLQPRSITMETAL